MRMDSAQLADQVAVEMVVVCQLQVPEEEEGAWEVAVTLVKGAPEALVTLEGAAAAAGVEVHEQQALGVALVAPPGLAAAGLAAALGGLAAQAAEAGVVMAEGHLLLAEVAAAVEGRGEAAVAAAAVVVAAGAAECWKTTWWQHPLASPAECGSCCSWLAACLLARLALSAAGHLPHLGSWSSNPLNLTTDLLGLIRRTSSTHKVAVPWETRAWCCCLVWIGGGCCCWAVRCWLCCCTWATTSGSRCGLRGGCAWTPCTLVRCAWQQRGET